jgi:tetratricopeptide (TPR) repeat protein
MVASHVCLENNPSSDFARLVTASAEMEAGNLIRAAAHLDRVAGVAGQPAGAASAGVGTLEHGDYDGWLTRLYAKLGFEFIKTGDGGHAELAFERGRSILATDPYINLGFAALSRGRGDWRIELKYLRLAVQSNPEMTTQRLGLANLLAAHGRDKEARAELGSLISVYPKLAAAYTTLADLQRKAGDIRSADATILAAYRNGALNRNRMARQ